MSTKVKDIDKGWKSFTRSVKELNGAVVKVGVIGSQGDQAKIATWNEFGTDDGRIPERSFLRSTVREKQNDYNEAIDKIEKKVLEKRGKIGTLLGLLGLKVQKDVQAKIIALKDPANAPSTISAKGSSNPLIDTGQLKNSITYEVENE